MKDSYGRMHDLGWEGGEGKEYIPELNWKMMYEIHKASIKKIIIQEKREKKEKENNKNTKVKLENKIKNKKK